MLFKHPPEPEKESERPWQADIDRIQQTLQQVLQAISSLSGVELPGATGKPGEAVPQVGGPTLKSRIHDDLEAYSTATAAELAQQAQQQTRKALEAIEHEVYDRIEQVTRESREKLQGRFEPGEIELDITQHARDRVTELIRARTDEFAEWVWMVCKGTGTPIPVQIEKLLKPYVDEATAGFTESFRQRVQDLLAEQEQVVQSSYQGTIKSLEDKMTSLEQAAQGICERNADSVTKLSHERLEAAADDAVKSFQGRIRDEAESNLTQLQIRLQELTTRAVEDVRREGALQMEGLKIRLEGLAGEVQEAKITEIAGRIEQTAADVIESSVQHLHHQADDALEHSRENLKEYLEQQTEEMRRQMYEVGRSAHESLSQDAARVAEGLKGLDQELAGIRDRHVAASEDQLSTVIRRTMESLTASIRQIADTQLEELNRLSQESRDRAAAQFESQVHAVTEGRYQDLLGRIQKEAGEAGAQVAAEVKAASESVMQELSSKVNASALVLREEADQATSRIELSLRSSLETYRQQLSHITAAGLEGHRQAISDSLSSLRSRLERSARALRGEPEEGAGKPPGES